LLVGAASSVLELRRVLQLALLLLLKAHALLCVAQSGSPLLPQAQAEGLYHLGSCTAAGCSTLAAVQLWCYSNRCTGPEPHKLQDTAISTPLNGCHAGEGVTHHFSLSGHRPQLKQTHASSCRKIQHLGFNNMRSLSTPTRCWLQLRLCCSSSALLGLQQGRVLHMHAVVALSCQRVILRM
jgi:hypothetical protein